MSTAEARRSRRFNVLIDAFNNEVNVTPSNEKGIFSPVRNHLSTMNARAANQDFAFMVPVTTKSGGLNTILMMEEPAGPEGGWVGGNKGSSQSPQKSVGEVPMINIGSEMVTSP